MAKDVDVRCEGETCDPSGLRLTVTETTWYLLDVTPDVVYPREPESEEPSLVLICLDCGREMPVSARLHARLFLG
jgi:hypothetical protein